MIKRNIISKRIIIIIPILFILLTAIRIYINYNDNQKSITRFITKHVQSIDSLFMVHRNYYQNLYLNKSIPLNAQTLKGLPAYSASIISEKFSALNQFQITIQTVSDRARNPKNSANTHELKAIEYFKHNPTEKSYLKKEALFFQYAKPLFIEQKCLKCHGKKEDAPKFISQKYDTAYNYKVGDVRGILSIKMPIAPIHELFYTQFLKSIWYDSLLLCIIFGIAYYLIRFFSKLNDRLKLTLDEKTADLQDSISYLESYKVAIDKGLIVTRTTPDGIITYANENFYKTSGFTEEEVIGKPHNIIRHPDNPKRLFENMWKSIQDKKSWRGHLKNRAKDGRSYWVDTHISPILDSQGEIVEFIAIRHEITTLLTQKMELQKIVITDALTGLYNRTALIEEIKKHKKIACILINIDSFSQINDFYGQRFGDKVIKEFANLLETMLPNSKNYKLFRLHSDEFVILAWNEEHYKIVELNNNILDDIVKKVLVIKNTSLTLNVTSGVSFEDQSNLLSSADMSVKIAKRAALNTTIYDPSISLDTEYENNMILTQKIKNAIANNKIIVYFQAIVDNHDKSVHRYETLVRLVDEDDKVIVPAQFLEIAKKSKLYKGLTRIIIKKSFEAFKDNKFEASINLCIDDILDRETYDYIMAMLKAYNIADRIIFEIVESEGIENFEKVNEFITAVKALGCRIAIDDFGTGYSNFEYLMKLNVDYLKIDGSIIKNILTDEKSEIITSVIIEFAKKMKIQTIGEFVESKEIYEKITSMGIDKSQGYYFSEPKASLE